MKYLFILILPLCIACNNVPEQGFTHKSEAKNLMVNGKKEGKWLEYFSNEYGDTTSDSNNYFSYSLTVYKNGEPIGIERIYYKNGEWQEVPHDHGRGNGVVKGFYKSGELEFEQPWENNAINGVIKAYYRSGKLRSETPCKNGIDNGVQKQYYESGEIKSETTYNNGAIEGTKNYDKNGNEIKQ